jgi:hypothetical protein
MRSVLLILALASCTKDPAPDPHEREACSSAVLADHPDATYCEAPCVESVGLRPHDEGACGAYYFPAGVGIPEYGAACGGRRMFTYGDSVGCCIVATDPAGETAALFFECD